MKTKLKTSAFAMLLLMGSLSLLAVEPTHKGFERLNKIYITATEALSKVSTEEEMNKVAAKLSKLHRRYEKDATVAAVLSLTPESCPESLQKAYDKSLKLQSDMLDAGKRLAMGSILRGGTNGAIYNKFTEMLKLTEKANDQAYQEGAPFETKEERDARMQWWRDGKFGMFIHYGLYSGLAGEVQGKKYQGAAEWIQMQSGLDAETYTQLAFEKFNPKSGKAAEWVKLAKEAGCTYTVLTSRHHEGFNMFDTKYTDFNVYKTNGIDVVSEYAEACAAYDMKAGYYVSMIDWWHPDYDPTDSGVSYPKGNYDAQKQGKRTFGNHERYKEYLHNIFEELLSKHHVDLVWWDFSQPNFQGDKAWGATRLMRTLFDKYPKAIQNNRLYHSQNHLSEGGIRVTPTWKGDYSTAEQHVPSTGIDGDWEACQTLNGTWGYSAHNHQWKSSEQLIRELIDAVSRGGNFLLNIGPEPDGSIPSESIRIFKEMGAWMSINNEAIYATRANPFPIELEWGRMTRKGDDTLYIFVYNKPENNLLTLPCTFEGEVSATVLGSDLTLQVNQDKGAKESSFNVNELTLQHAATVIKVVGKRTI